MSSSVIRVEKIGKQYRVGALEGGGTGLLRDKIAGALRDPLSMVKRKPKETFWALKDISFEVKEGEVLGLIGRNGAGKSTLLKILSRITKPTVGHAEIHGRVGSLLEVATGFHPELSGRENVFLNGAILGMRRREITRKFDEIVAFAEVAKFIDTPVKHYSSGMYVRLAFAVAAHLETEILFVDEVLSVGDAAFQKKCLGKMGQVSSEGRTILFVSHNMTAVRSLCSCGYLLEGGKVTFAGPVGQCIDRYVESGQQLCTDVNTRGWERPEVVARDATLRVTRVRLEARREEPLVYTAKPLKVRLEFEVKATVREVLLGFAIHSQDGLRLFDCRTIDSYGPIPVLAPGNYFVDCTVPENPLNPGWYALQIGARCAKKGLDWLPDVMSFQVEIEEGLGSVWLEERSGVIRQDSVWSRPSQLAAPACEQTDEFAAETGTRQTARDDR